MRQLVAVQKLLRVVAHILVGAWTIRWVFPRLPQAQRDARVQVWARTLLAHLAIKLVVNGNPPTIGPVLLAANHISWLDIVILHAARHCRFVSKSDVQKWPVVSTLADGAGTLYIHRESRRDAMRVVHQMAQYLSASEVLAVFPEGTTGNGAQLLPFHANLLQAAITANAPVQPVALHFADESTGCVSFAPCYVGDDTLWSSLWRTLCTPGVVAVVQFGEPQWARGRERRAWAQDLQQDVASLRGDVKLPA
jgi:1-acyl-sn-glycerol-3-phosphate acyltransferase